ncbi:hypothetical protein [Streptomyces sp. SAS_270]|uniref:hypothetical protein n=1 Tax=Streptomyces sp. SAS_270 TaxID=3412748 RepID=UPI00403D1B6D
MTFKQCVDQGVAEALVLPPLVDPDVEDPSGAAPGTLAEAQSPYDRVLLVEQDDLTRRAWASFAPVRARRRRRPTAQFGDAAHQHCRRGTAVGEP